MDLEELIQSIDIVEYISQFVDLKEKGGEFWGLSCFKEENTPSFSVRRNPPVFYDFSSGIGGNLWTFVKSYYRCSGREAVDILKSYAGVSEVTNTSGGSLSALADCKKYAKPKAYQKALGGTVLADDYMERYEKDKDKFKAWESEGISADSLKRFEVRYDRFSDRLVYPIRNIEGKIVNVGGRALNPHWKENGERKYTYFFSWGRMDAIYGIFENMDYILNKKEVILFEGVKSVLIADTWGIKNTGAILTCHLNSSQLKILARLGVRVVFALDKEVRVREDKNIKILGKYVNCEYLYDKSDLLDPKDSPVDKGKDTFLKLYSERLRFR